MKNKTTEQLIKEINQLKDKVVEMEKSETKSKQSEIILENLPVGYNLFDMEGKVISIIVLHACISEFRRMTR